MVRAGADQQAENPSGAANRIPSRVSKCAGLAARYQCAGDLRPCLRRPPMAGTRVVTAGEFSRPCPGTEFYFYGGAMPFTEVPAKVDFPEQERQLPEVLEESHSFEKLAPATPRTTRTGHLIDGPITANNPDGCPPRLGAHL